MLSIRIDLFIVTLRFVYIQSYKVSRMTCLVSLEVNSSLPTFAIFKPCLTIVDVFPKQWFDGH